MQGEHVRRLCSHAALARLRTVCPPSGTPPSGNHEGVLAAESATSAACQTVGGAGAASAHLPLAACVHLVPEQLRRSAVYELMARKTPAGTQHIVIDPGAASRTDPLLCVCARLTCSRF